MSQANLDLVRGIWEADRRGDWKAVRAAYSDDVVWEDHAGLWGDWGVARGPDGIHQAWRRWYEAFEDVQIEFGEVAHGGDVVVVTYGLGARGRGSGVAVRQTITLMWTLKAGKVVQIRAYTSRDEALEAAGLREQRMDDGELRALAEAAYAALNRGDLDGFLALIGEDVEFTSLVAEAEGTTFRGHQGVRAWWDTVYRALDTPRWELLEVRTSGDRGAIKLRMSGAIGGAQVAQTIWQASAVRDGKVRWWAFFRTEQEALEAAGLTEGAGYLERDVTGEPRAVPGGDRGVEPG
jgi:ketosteroid isomerase-like protein